MAFVSKMVLIPKQTRRQVLEHIFKEGVIVVKHDANASKHNEEALEDVPNLHVMMICRSLASRGYLDEKFNWQWHYYFLTNEGIDFLREKLSIPQNFMGDLVRTLCIRVVRRPVRVAVGSCSRASNEKK